MTHLNLQVVILLMYLVVLVGTDSSVIYCVTFTVFNSFYKVYKCICYRCSSVWTCLLYVGYVEESVPSQGCKHVDELLVEELLVMESVSVVCQCDGVCHCT